MRTLSAKRLGIMLTAMVIGICMLTVTTFSALQATKTATGTITFTGDLALAMTHGASGDNNTLTLALTPNFDKVKDIADSGNLYLDGQTGKVASLDWPKNGGSSDIKFSVYTDGNTSVYLKFTIELIYTPADTNNVPANAQDMLVYPIFGSSNYAMTATKSTVNGNTEYSYYGASDGMVISHPEYVVEGTKATKRFNCYYMEFPANSSEATMKAFAPASTSSAYTGYTHLNKSVNFSDIISDIQFVIEGGLSPNDGDKFELKIKCDCAIFPQL